jgi:hypothetical protein
MQSFPDAAINRACALVVRGSALRGRFRRYRIARHE